jgi:hypothetical protein
MAESPKFKLWLAIETGRAAVVDAAVDQIHVPDTDIQVEVKRAGRWQTVASDQLTDDC